MKTFSFVASLVIAAASVAPAAAQYSGSPRSATATRSVLKQPDHVEWADYHVGTVAGPGISGCPEAHVTCSTGVCYGYDNCCCRPLLCTIKRIGRMLDCLLPCNKCCNGGCLFSGRCCGPHLFHRGCCGGYDGCGIDAGCAAPSCSSPIGYPGGYPGATDPFIDDPLPPRPTPEPARDVRYRPTPALSPAPSPLAAHRASPYKVTTASEIDRQHAFEAARREAAPVAAPLTTPHNPRDKFAVQPQPARRVPAASAHSRPVTRSPLQPAVAEEEVSTGPSRLDGARTAPGLLPVTIRRTSAELPAEELEIPVNPLRR